MSPPIAFTNSRVHAEADTSDGQNGFCLLGSSEHVPTNLTLNGPKLPSSAIGRHIIDSGHVIDKTKAFKVITRARNAQLLRFAEASAIRRIKPDLCVQKDFVAHLALPWWIIIQPYVLTIPQLLYLNYIPNFWFFIYSAVYVYVYLIVFSIAFVSILINHPSKTCFSFTLFS